MAEAKIIKGELGTFFDDLEAEAAGLRESIIVESWPKLSVETNFLRPKTVTVLAGPPGEGKSMMVLELLLRLYYQGVAWELLPLEDSASDVYRRMCALIAEDWSLMNTDATGALRRAELTNLYAEDMYEIEKRVNENPRGVVDGDGNEEIPVLPWMKVVEWLREAVTKNRVVVVDPLAQIDWVGGKLNEMQSKFMRNVTAIASKSSATIILVAHPQKRPGKAAGSPLVIDDTQGSADITRLGQTVLMLSGHQRKESLIFGEDGLRTPVSHTRTLIVSKCRNGRGKGLVIAYDSNPDSPGMVELGVIAPKE